ncbi:transcriptional regulator [Nocardiopsis sp. TSRI0078]|uniref:TFIIB-type zinc ribbon-containing protein n=1 Tax=unclassified Nocardiopsis TaxID=2649073 RepID=UPI00095AAE53|nr:transcriptional regulator [Nocardiopsis sp. TSRI0078]
MRTFDRQGVHIDRCDGCQGIFLDRGELERVMEAEQRHYGVAPPPDPQVRPQAYPQAPPPPAAYPHQAPPPHAAYPRGGYPDSPRGYRDSPRGYGGYRDSPGPYRGRRKKSFLEQLFD